MNHHSIWASLLFPLVCLLRYINTQQPQYNTIFLTEYCRHGARTTWNNKMNLPITQQLGTGNITANGMRMHFMLGSQLRMNYPSIFQKQFSPYDAEIFTSSVQRTIQSAHAHLLGMYPLGTGEQMTIPNNSPFGLPPWQGLSVSFSNFSALPRAYRPFPYQTMTPDIDFFFFPSMFATCPNVDAQVKQETKNLVNQYNYLVTDLSTQLINAGFDPSTWYNQSTWTIDIIALFYDEMKSYLTYYGTYYNNLPEALFNKTYLIANLNFNFLFPQEKYFRMFANGIGQDILSGLQAVVNGKSPKKFRMYSGHDTGVWAHMNLLNLTSRECLLDLIQTGSTTRPCQLMPDFASSFLYELNTIGGSYYVRILLNGNPIAFCPGLADPYNCPFNVFSSTFSNMVFFNGDFQAACGNTMLATYAKNNADHKPLVVTLVILLIVLAISILSLLAFNFLTDGLRAKIKERGMSAL